MLLNEAAALGCGALASRALSVCVRAHRRARVRARSRRRASLIAHCVRLFALTCGATALRVRGAGKLC